MGSTLLIHFSCSHGVGEHSLPKSICHPNPDTQSLPAPALSVELPVGFDITPPRWGTKHGCPCSGIPLSLVFSDQQWICWGLSGPPVLPLWFTSSFEALRGEFDNDSHSPPHGTGGEGSTTQVWLKQGQRTVAFLGVLYIPCLRTVLTHHFPPTLCTAPSHPKLGGPRSFCLLQLHSGQTLLVLKYRR